MTVPAAYPAPEEAKDAAPLALRPSSSLLFYGGLPGEAADCLLSCCRMGSTVQYCADASCGRAQVLGNVSHRFALNEQNVGCNSLVIVQGLSSDRDPVQSDQGDRITIVRTDCTVLKTSHRSILSWLVAVIGKLSPLPVSAVGRASQEGAVASAGTVLRIARRPGLQEIAPGIFQAKLNTGLDSSELKTSQHSHHVNKACWHCVLLTFLAAFCATRLSSNSLTTSDAFQSAAYPKTRQGTLPPRRCGSPFLSFLGRAAMRSGRKPGLTAILPGDRDGALARIVDPDLSTVRAFFGILKSGAEGHLMAAAAACTSLLNFGRWSAACARFFAGWMADRLSAPRGAFLRGV